MTRRGTTFVVAAMFVCFFVVTGTSAAQNNIKPCTTIQSGTLAAPIDVVLVTNTDLDVGEIHDAQRMLSVGYDEYGYNYQAHNFGGFYKNWDRPPRLEWMPSQQWADDQLSMSWNDAFLSNKDCGEDRDGKLDRPTSYQGSGAQVVIHFGGLCDNLKQWTRQVELSAAPADAAYDDLTGTWSLKGKTLGFGVDITFGDATEETLVTGLVLTKDNISTSCPTLERRTRFVIPVAPFESIKSVQIGLETVQFGIQ